MSLSASYKPIFKHKRIGSLFALHKALVLSNQSIDPPHIYHLIQKNLATSPESLLTLANESDSLYQEVRIPKSDGSSRITYNAAPLLKAVQRRIKTQILDHVLLPDYLTGCIKGRDCKTNAEKHLHARIVINEDISSFFPSTKEKQVFDVWFNFFKFSKEVATCLTKLTTRCGELPQGASTSSTLANLIFWKDEPTLVHRLNSAGLIYSRYVDDISVSSKTFLSNREKANIIRQIYGMLKRHGYSPKRDKHAIYTSGNRLPVTKLSVNTIPGINKGYRSQIRQNIYTFRTFSSAEEPLTITSASQIQGQIRYIERFHPGKAALLKKQLITLSKKH